MNAILSPDARLIVEKSPLASKLPLLDASNIPAFVIARVVVAATVATTRYVSFVVVVVCCDCVPDVRVSTSVNSVVSVIAAVPAPVPIPTYLEVDAASRAVIIAFPALVRTDAIFYL